MLLPQGILIYLIMIMASLERAGERMLVVYSAHVVHNKINNHNRKWIRRTQSGITSNLYLIGHGPKGLPVEEFGH